MSTVHEQVAIYQGRLAELYGQIAEWCFGMNVVTEMHDVALDEDEIGEYTVAELRLTAANGDVLASLRPVGMKIIGAEGQVRLRGRFDERIVTYFDGPGPTLPVTKSEEGVEIERYEMPILKGLNEPGWYIIIDPKSGETRRLDRDLFFGILREVSDYDL